MNPVSRAGKHRNERRNPLRGEDTLYAERPPRFARWLTEPIRDNRATHFKVGLAAAVINLFSLVTSLFTKTVYDRVFPNEAIESLVAFSIGLAIILVFDFALHILRGFGRDFSLTDAGTA